MSLNADSPEISETALARPAPRDAWLTLKHLAAGRLLLAVLLMGLVVLELHEALIDSVTDRSLFTAAVIVYLAVALAAVVAVRRWRVSLDRQLAVQVAADLVLLMLLTHAAGGARGGFALLLVAAVAGAALLTTMLRAVFIAAIASLLVLGDALWRVGGASWHESGLLTPAGMVGAACFAIAVLVNRLSTRLATQEAIARKRGEDLRVQLAVMRLVISEMSQGVVIVDRDGQVRTMNRTAQNLLGSQGPWPWLDRLVEQWRRQAQDEVSNFGDGIEVSLSRGGEDGASGAAERTLRLRFLGPSGLRAADSVILVEDIRQLEERAQQLKLASMGRLSASIAHEIRNPLAAIRHANGLLTERVEEGLSRRLTRIVEDSSVRINRIVEDVLSIARRERPASEPIRVQEFLDSVVAQCVLDETVNPGRIRIVVNSEEAMIFDPRHLRQVLTNLLGNALRYASAGEGAVLLEWRGGQGRRLELWIFDDGPGMEDQVLAHVFEPFFTTESRGTGLGLFLAREFCTANGASLRYERLDATSRYSGAFVITPDQGEA